MGEDLYQDITGVILVGGKSRRMGRDKAFLEVGGLPLVARVLAAFRECFTRVILVGDREERFAGYDLPVVPDIYPGSSLGGLYTGLLHAETDRIFVSSCDMPYPSGAVMRHICSLGDGFDVVVPSVGHGYEPLFALYAKTCLGPMQAYLESGQCCAYGYYPQLRVREVPDADLIPLDPCGKSFINLNTPEDVARIGEEP